MGVKKYTVQIPGEEHVANWDEKEYGSKKEALFEKYPDAQVTELSLVNRDEIDPEGDYEIHVPGQEHVAQWKGTEFAMKGDALYTKYPKAQVYRKTDVSSQMRDEFVRNYEDTQDQLRTGNLTDRDRVEKNDYLDRYRYQYESILESRGTPRQYSIEKPNNNGHVVLDTKGYHQYIDGLGDGRRGMSADRALNEYIPSMDIAEVSKVDPNDVRATGQYQVKIPGERGMSTLSGEELLEIRDILLRDHPDMEVYRVSANINEQRDKDFVAQYEKAQDRASDEKLTEGERQQYADFVEKFSQRYDALKKQFGGELLMREYAGSLHRSKEAASRRPRILDYIIGNAGSNNAEPVYSTRQKLRYYSANGEFPQELKDAGLTAKDVEFHWGGGQSGAGYYTLSPSQAKQVDENKKQVDRYVQMFSPTTVVETLSEEDGNVENTSSEKKEHLKGYTSGLKQSLGAAKGQLMVYFGEKMRLLGRLMSHGKYDDILWEDAKNELNRRIESGEPIFRNDQTPTRAQKSVMSKEEYNMEQRKEKANAFINELRQSAIDDGQDPEETVIRLLGGLDLNKNLAHSLTTQGSEIIDDNSKPLDGFAAKLGAMTPMLGTAAVTAGLAYTGNEGAAKAFADVTLAMFAASAAGGSMKQARDAGASNTEVLTAGVASGAIMYGFSQIPFTKFINRMSATSAAKSISGMSTNDAGRELQMLLRDAASRGYLTKETASSMAKQWGEHIVTSTGSFAAMSAAGALVPLIYEDPERYPVLANVLNATIEGAEDGLIMGTFMGGISTGANVIRTTSRWAKQGDVYLAEVQSNGDNDVYARYNTQTKSWEPMMGGGQNRIGTAKPSEIGFAEVIDVKQTYAESRKLLGTSDENGAGLNSGVAIIQTSDGNIFAVNPSVLKVVRKFHYRNAEERAREAYRDSGYDAGEAAQTPEQKTDIRVDNEYQTRKAEKEAAQGGVSEGTQLDVDRANAAMEGRRNAMRTQMEQRIGKPFWTGANGSETVDVLELKDDRIVFVLSEDEKGVVGVDKDGKPVMIDKDSDNIFQRYQESLNEYLDAQVFYEDQIAERERMATEQADNVMAIIEKVQQDGKVNLSAEENPVWGTVVNINPAAEGGVTVQVEGEANPRFLNWKQVSSTLNMPFEPKSNEDLVADRLKVDEEVDNYNNNIPVDSDLMVQLEGGDVVAYKFKNAEQVDGDIILHAEDTETGEVVDIFPEMVTNLDALVKGEVAVPDVDGNPVPVSTSEPVEPAAPVFSDPVANELGIDAKFAHTTPSGEVVVDGRMLWNENPELWAEWNDRNPDRGIPTREYLEDKQQKATQEALDALEAYKAEWKGNQDPDVLQTLKAEMDKKTDRKQRIDNLVKKYDEAEKAAELERNQPAPVEEVKPAEPAAPAPVVAENPTPEVSPSVQAVTPKEILQNELSAIDAKIKESPAEQKQELLRQRNTSVQRYVDGARVYGDTEATTISDLANRMTAEGVDRKTSVYVQDVIDRASKNGEVVRGVTITKSDGSRKAFLVSDNLRDAVDVNGALVHEEWHIANGSNGLIERLTATEGLDKNNMLAAISYWSRGSKHYDSDKSTGELADEYIAMAMEATDGLPDAGIAAELAKAGVTNPEIVNFVKTHRNERGLLQGVSDTRRDRIGYGNPSVSGPENGGDRVQRSEGDLGQSGAGSLESSGDGTGAGEELTSIREQVREESNTPDENGVTPAQTSEITAAVGGEMEKGPATKFSVTAIAEGAGLEAIGSDSEGNVVFVGPDGKRFTGKDTITADYLKNLPNTVIGYMMEDAKRIGTVNGETEGILWKKYADMLNAFLQKGLAENGGINNLASQWQWIAETVYKTVASNSDAQYSYSLDITRVCKKNEAVIKTIAEVQRRLGRGVTPAEIMEIYLASEREGYQVPCPVCYVFSRYIRNGQYATIMINGQRKYGSRLKDPRTLTAEEKEAEINYWKEELDKQQKNNARNKKAITKAKADIQSTLDEIDKLGRRLLLGIDTGEKAEDTMMKIYALDERYRAALQVVSQAGLDGWITNFAIHEVNGKMELYDDSYQGFPEEMALDLRETATVLREYPAIQRYRNSRGAAAGKEITFEANNDLGEVPMMLGVSDLKNAPNYYKLAVEATDPVVREEMLKKARERFTKAHLYAQRQSLRGGQRQWSWSDNIERLSPDVFVNLMQMEMLGGALQSYSKQLEGINLVARMGGYVNGSLMGKGIGYREVDPSEVVRDGDNLILKDGDLIISDGVAIMTPVYEKDGKYYTLEFDDVVGVDAYGKDENGHHYKGLFELNHNLDKAGNILVGMDDLHIRVAMADDRVFFIIPWHSSGGSVHILKQMLRYLNVDLKNFKPTDYTNVQEEKAAMNSKGKINPRLVEFWEAHKNETDFPVGIAGGIPSGKGGKLSDEQIHYKELRDAIFVGIKEDTGKLNKDGKPVYKNVPVEKNPAWMREIMRDEFLSQAYAKVRGMVDDGAMTSTDTKYIYPYEYWDETSTYATADINGARYLEYCRRLGYKPKFVGKLDGKPASDFGNFADDKGYWKLLIDRRMYDTRGYFQDLTPVSSEGFSTDLVDPEKTAQEFKVTRVADDAAAKVVADRMLDRESARPSGVATVNYDSNLDEAVKNYNAVLNKKPTAPTKEQREGLRGFLGNLKEDFGDTMPEYEEKKKSVMGGQPMFSIHGREVQYPESVTQEQRDEIEKTLTDYTNQEKHQKALDIIAGVNEEIKAKYDAERLRVEQENLAEVKSVKDRLSILGRKRGELYAKDPKGAEFKAVVAEIGELRKRAKELSDKIPSLNLNTQENKELRDNAIASLFDNTKWRSVAVVPTHIRAVDEVLREKGWNGQSNMALATERGYMGHQAGHHADMSATENSADMLQNLYEPDTVGFEKGHEDTLLFIRKSPKGFWYTTGVAVDKKIKGDGSLMFVTTYKDKEDPRNRLTRILDLGYPSGAAASSRVSWDFDNHGANIGINSESAIDSAKNLQETGGATFSIVSDPKLIEELEASEKVTGIREVVKNPDGSYSSPMAGNLGRAKTNKSQDERRPTSKFYLQKWNQSEENPDLADENGKIKLIKTDNSKRGLVDVDAVDYNPYNHLRLTAVNKQFKDAWKRPDLVYIKSEVPKSEVPDFRGIKNVEDKIGSPYHAEKAVLPVGIHDWNGGPLMLSRYDKPVGEIDWEEVADAWANDEDIRANGAPFDIVNPQLLQPLVDRGIEIVAPSKGQDKNEAYKAWKAGDMRTYEAWRDTGKAPKKLTEAQKRRANNVIDYLFNGAESIAPAGPSNLNERQYKEVRTDNYKNWFGDWENDPENASKIVDENGEPLIVYHHTENDIDAFDISKARRSMDVQGFFFYDDANAGEEYGSKNYPVYLNIRNPFVVDNSDALKKASPDLSKTDDGVRVREELQAEGYDGIIYDKDFMGSSATEIVAFEPNQIKSATNNNGDFSTENNDIRFSIAYHGSPSEFDKFDHSYMGEGEGHQAHGWGTYVSMKKGTAERYAYLGERDRVSYDGPDFPSHYAKELVGAMVLEYQQKGTPLSESKARILKMLEGIEKDRKEGNVSNYWKNHSVEREIDFLKGINDDNFEIKEVSHNLYDLEIPDDNGHNYIVEDKSVRKPERTRIAEALRGLADGEWKVSEDEANLFRDYTAARLADRLDKRPMTGGELYANLVHGLGSKKAASEFLNNAGFVGIKYDGRVDGECAVIFNDDDIEIINHVRFSVTAEQDDEYMNAASSGDLDKAGKMVLAVAKESMPDTKVVDEDGNPLLMYHGTITAGFTEFKSRDGRNSIGWFTSSKPDADSYAGNPDGKLYDSREKPSEEVLKAGDYRLNEDMVFDSQEDLDEFVNAHPGIKSYMSERELSDAMNEVETDAEEERLQRIKEDSNQIRNDYRKYEREHFVTTTIGDVLNNPDSYVLDDLKRAWYALDSNAAFDDVEDLPLNEQKDALISSLREYVEEDEADTIGISFASRVPRNGEGIKANDTNRRTYAAYINLVNPLVIDARGRHSEFESADIYKAVEEAMADDRYDGVLINNWRVGRYQQLGDVAVPKRSSQIKSADTVTYDDAGNVIPLSERFNDSNDDIRFSFLGEKGAEALDKASNATVRIHNRDIAIAMEEIDADPLAIKMATGWERGADGAWRYESSDVIAPSEKINALKTGDSIRLGDLVNPGSGPLIAYPELADFTVKVVPRKESFYGQLKFNEKKIDLNLGRMSDEYSDYVSETGRADHTLQQYLGVRANSTLAHEVQHAIQHIEGFALGDNTSIKESSQILNRVGNDNPALPRMINIFGKVPAKKLKSIGRENIAKAASGENAAKTGFNTLNDKRKAIAKQLAEDLYNMSDSEFSNMVSDMTKVIKEMREEAVSNYRRSSGEVEARNVQHRQAMTPEQRERTLAESTEDVPRNEQIVTRKQTIQSFEENGLGGVIGEENVEPLMRSVYAAIPKSVKAPIVDKAVDGLDFRKPLNEYLHELAAKGTENDETGLLFAMYDEIRALTGNPDLTDNDIRYMIWKSSGESNGDILSMAEDIAVRNRWNVGKDEPKFSVRKQDLTEAVENAQENLDEKMANAEEDLKEAKDAAPHLMDVLNPIIHSMSAQKEYDRATVDGIVDFAKQIIKNGGMTGLNTRDFNRMLTVIKSSVGKSPKSVEKYSNELLDKLLDHMVKDERTKFEKLVNIKDVTTNQSGVAAIGSLDVIGQKMMETFRNYMFVDKTKIDARIEDVEEKFDSEDDEIRRNAFAEYDGLQLAKEYQSNLAENIEEANKLNEEIQDAKDAKKTGNLSAKEYSETYKVIEQALRLNKIERVDSYRDLISKLSEKQKGSKIRAKSFRDKEKERVDKIHHLANLDMQGTPNKEHLEPGWKSRALNSTGIRFFLKPLATFDQMLRLFGRSTVTGEGYLYNHFGRGWIDAREKELVGKEEAMAELDTEVQDVFDDPDMKWAKLYDKERKMPGATVYFFDGGEKVAHDLTPGNLLYIYMANKMIDGKMKLRKMGISEDDVTKIKESLDPKFVELADWLQEEFLPKRRAKYNAVHEEMFGAPMAAIDDYFPLKILSNARVENIDLADDPNASGLSSTTTGSIVKRQKNSLALDLLNTDAFSLAVEHIEEMENWAAFAKLRRDMNTLLSYKRFRNQVQNMDTVYGSGKVLWDNFRDVASIAMGNYKPKVGKQDIDTLALNVAKGVTGAKIAFRIGTALKQVLSAPAFLSDARIDILAKNLATAPLAWNWCEENLPVFRERWNSRFAGDTRLMKTESDWKLWKTKLVQKAGMLGMSPNAFVDALTVAVGAKSMYDTNYKRYVDGGYSEEEADRKAKQDATILYNQTQQSSEAMFTSAMQLDRTLGAVMFTVFRNSSMGYTRQTHDAFRIYGRMMQKGYKERAIERMTRQRMEDGLGEDEAKAFAKKEYNRQYWRSAARIGVFAFLLPLAWNYGVGDLLYVLFGDDDKEKEKIHNDALGHTLAGPIEGLTAGSVLSSGWGTWWSTRKTGDIGLAELPIESDLDKILSMRDYDAPAAVAEIINLIIQSGIGVNPQTFTDAMVATIDAFEGDMDAAKEFAIWLMRVNQLPQPSIERFLIDEVGMAPEEAKAARLEDLARRYADYKLRKGAPLNMWMYNEGLYEKRHKSYEKKFKDKVSDREDLHMDEQETN